MSFYPNQREYTSHSAWKWRTFPFFGYHVVKYGRGMNFSRKSWHLSKYKARCLARELYRHDLTEYRNK